MTWAGSVSDHPGDCRNSTKTWVSGGQRRRARPNGARARPQPRKVAADPLLGQRVLADLRQSRTPRQIAGRLKLEAEDATVEAARRVPHRPVACWLRTRRSTSSFTPCPAPSWSATGLPALQAHPAKALLIEQARGPDRGMRPITARENEHPAAPSGGYPALGRRPDHRQERRQRCSHHGRADVPVHRDRGLHHGKSSDDLAEVLIEHVNALPEMMRASLTWDQGSEMVCHAALTVATDLPVYFADPHSPGSVPATRTQRPDP